MPDFSIQDNTKNLFSHYFSTMKDPRRTNKGNHLYPLDEVLFLTISAVISSVEGWEDICEFGNLKISWLRKFFAFKNGIPSHDVLSKLFARLDTKTFNQCFIDWINSISEITENEVIAIDGKTIRKSNDKNRSKSAYHMVSAYASDNRVCLGQDIVNEKSNEITAIPKLLDLIAVKGAIVTIDAMGCQTNIADIIIEKKANYILALKGNQKSLKEQVVNQFNQTKPSSVDESVDSGHGRVETRTCEVIDNLTTMDSLEKWKNLNSIVKITSKRYVKSTEKESTETRYYISSLKTDAKSMNQYVRKHWSVENNLHWNLDVVFKEDASLKKKDKAPVNFNIVRKMALAMIERDDYKKKSKNIRRLKAALDDKYRTKIITS